MRKKKEELQLEQNQINRTEEMEFLKKRTIKELIAPAGIDLCFKNRSFGDNIKCKKIC